MIALMLSEPVASALAARLAADPDRVMSTASYIEAGLVLAGRRSDRLRAIDNIDALLANFGIELRPVDTSQARIALAARIAYGRGMRHGGVLNFGDVFSYALAKSLDAPLLYVGRDFATTDIESALDYGPPKMHLSVVLPIVLSIASLSASAYTLWLMHLRQGRLQMTQPMMVFFGRDDPITPKFWLRTLIFSTSATGHIIETMFLRVRTPLGFTAVFDFWTYEDQGKQARGSGLHVGKTGVTLEHFQNESAYPAARK